MNYNERRDKQERLVYEKARRECEKARNDIEQQSIRIDKVILKSGETLEIPISCNVFIAAVDLMALSGPVICGDSLRLAVHTREADVVADLALRGFKEP